MVFSSFLNFFAFFLEFSTTGRVGIHGNDFFFFLFSLFLGLSQPILPRKEAMMVFSKFLNFFAIFLEFFIHGRVGTHWNDFFYFIFSLSRPFPTYFGLKRSYDGVFQIFEFFFYFFGIFYSYFFLFLSLSHPFLA